MNAVAKIDDINTTVDGWKDDFARVMASDVDPDKFAAAVTTALAMNPEIVRKCSAESIKTACIKAAYDGLRPDGKEGALVAYGAEAQWMPMVYGIRKKAKEHDGIIIRARAVFEKDKFLWSLGDDEKIEHEPAPPAVDPGAVVASYAIFMKGDEILHREVMRLVDINKVRSASKAPNSPAWVKWFDEMARKAAVNRGSKSVPMSDAVLQVISRDNDHYELRDVTPGAPAVALNARFGGKQSADGFSPDNVKQLTNSGQVAMETVDQKTGEILKTEVQRTAAVTDKTTSSSAKAASAKSASNDADRGGQSSTADGSRSTNSSQGSDDRSKSDDGGKQETSSQRLPAELFRKYASSLARMQTEGNVDKASAQFWPENGGAPKGLDRALAKSIYDKQMARAKGDTDAEGLLDEIHADIETSFAGSDL